MEHTLGYGRTASTGGGGATGLLLQPLEDGEGLTTPGCGRLQGAASHLWAALLGLAASRTSVVLFMTIFDRQVHTDDSGIYCGFIAQRKHERVQHII